MYETDGYCQDGTYGPSWEAHMGTFAKFAVNGLGADSACCACGKLAKPADDEPSKKVLPVDGLPEDQQTDQPASADEEQTSDILPSDDGFPDVQPTEQPINQSAGSSADASPPTQPAEQSAQEPTNGSFDVCDREISTDLLGLLKTAYVQGKEINLNSQKDGAQGVASIPKQLIQELGAPSRSMAMSFEMFIGNATHPESCSSSGMTWSYGASQACVVQEDTDEQTECNGIVVGFKPYPPALGIHVSKNGIIQEYLSDASLFLDKWITVVIRIHYDERERMNKMSVTLEGKHLFESKDNSESVVTFSQEDLYMPNDNVNIAFFGATEGMYSFPENVTVAGNARIISPLLEKPRKTLACGEQHKVQNIRTCVMEADEEHSQTETLPVKQLEEQSTDESTDTKGNESQDTQQSSQELLPKSGTESSDSKSSDSQDTQQGAQELLPKPGTESSDSKPSDSSTSNDQHATGELLPKPGVESADSKPSDSSTSNDQHATGELLPKPGAESTDSKPSDSSTSNDQHDTGELLPKPGDESTVTPTDDIPTGKIPNIPSGKIPNIPSSQKSDAKKSEEISPDDVSPKTSSAGKIPNIHASSTSGAKLPLIPPISVLPPPPPASQPPAQQSVCANEISADQLELLKTAFIQGNEINLNSQRDGAQGLASISKQIVQDLGVPSHSMIMSFEMFIGNATHPEYCSASGMTWSYGASPGCGTQEHVDDQTDCNGIVVAFKSYAPSSGIHISKNGIVQNYLSDANRFLEKWVVVDIDIEYDATNNMHRMNMALDGEYLFELEDRLQSGLTFNAADLYMHNENVNINFFGATEGVYIVPENVTASGITPVIMPLLEKAHVSQDCTEQHKVQNIRICTTEGGVPKHSSTTKIKNIIIDADLVDVERRIWLTPPIYAFLMCLMVPGMIIALSFRSVRIKMLCCRNIQQDDEVYDYISIP